MARKKKVEATAAPVSAPVDTKAVEAAKGTNVTLPKAAMGNSGKKKQQKAAEISPQIVASPVQTEPELEQDSGINMQGLTATQKKNLKRKMKKQETKKQLDVESGGDVGNPLQQRIQKQVLEWAARRQALDKEIASLAGSKQEQNQSTSVMGEVSGKVAALIKDMQTVYDAELAKAKKPVSKKNCVESLNEQIAQVENTLVNQQKQLQRVQQNPSKATAGAAATQNAAEWEVKSAVEESKRYLVHLKEQLVLVVQMRELQQLNDIIKEYQAHFDQLLSKKHTKQENNNTSSDNRRGNQKEAQWRRRLTDFGVTIPAQFSSFVTQSVDLPVNAFLYLFEESHGERPSLLMRKIERKHGVLIERQGARANATSCTLNIIGVSTATVQQAYLFLIECEFPPAVSESETIEQQAKLHQNVVSLAQVNIGAFMGNGGGNITKLEQETGLLIAIQDKRLIAFGSTDSIKNGMKVVMAAIDTSAGARLSGVAQLEMSFPVLIGKALSQCGVRMRAKIVDIEKQHAVSFSMRNGRKDMETFPVMIRGSNSENCVRAQKALSDLTEKFIVKVLECKPPLANRLLRGATPNFFPNLLDEAHVTVLKVPEGIALVGPAQALEKASADALVALENMNVATQTVEIDVEDLKILNRNKRGEIELASGAICKAPILPTSQEPATALAKLVFRGTEAQVQKAVELVETCLKEKGVKESVQSSVHVIMELLNNRAVKLKELERLCQVRVHINRASMGLDVVGKEENIQLFKEQLDQLSSSLMSDSTFVIQSFPVSSILDQNAQPRDPSQACSHSMATMCSIVNRSSRKIQLETNILWLNVDDTSGVVTLRGTSESIPLAMARIQSVLLLEDGSQDKENADGSLAAANGVSGTAKRGARHVGGRARGAHPVSAHGHEKSHKNSGKRMNQDPFQMDETLFPTLENTIKDATGSRAVSRGGETLPESSMNALAAN